MIFCIGPTGCGKTSLLECICKESYDPDQETVPSVGVNIFNLKLKKAIHKQKSIVIRELGGALCPVWSSYLRRELFLIFLIDPSNPGQLPQAVIHLAETLELLEQNSRDLEKPAHLLIVYSKSDLVSGNQLSSYQRVSRLNQLITASSVNVSTVKFSSKTKEGFDDIISWIKRIATENGVPK